MEVRCKCNKMLGTVEDGNFQHRHGTHKFLIEGVAVKCTRCGEITIIKVSQETSGFMAQKAVNLDERT